MGSGTSGHPARARPLGRALAVRGVHLVTGGGGGVMAEVARSFTGSASRAGLSIGILPAGEEGPAPPPGYPNPWVEIPILTHLPDRGAGGRTPGSRNHLVVLTAQVVVALPGSAGTLSEVQLALEYGRPVVAHLEDRSELPGLPPGVRVARSLEEVSRFLDSALVAQDEPPDR